MATLSLIGVLLLSQATEAEPPREAEPQRDLLALMDWYVGQIHDQTSALELSIEDGAGLARTFKMEFSIREGRSALAVQAPADLRGLRFLSVARDQFYYTAPLTYRLRRFTNRPFSPLFGSAFTYEDFLHFQLSPSYEAQVVPIDTERATLRARAKPGSHTPYDRIDMDFALATLWIAELRYYDAKGRLLRTETREEPLCDQDICLPGKRRMVDHRRGDLVSEARIHDLKINAGLPARSFSLNGIKPYY